MKNTLHLVTLILSASVNMFSQNYVTGYRLIAERNDYYNYFTGILTPTDSLQYFYTADRDTLQPFVPVNLIGSSTDYDTLTETVSAIDSAWHFYYFTDIDNWNLLWKWYTDISGELLHEKEFHYCTADSCFMQNKDIYYYDASGKLVNHSQYSAPQADTTYKTIYQYQDNMLINATSYNNYYGETTLNYTFDYTYNAAGLITSKNVHKYEIFSEENYLYSKEEFFYDDANHLIQYNYHEADYTNELIPKYIIHYSYSDDHLAEKTYEDYNTYYDEWSYSEKYDYQYSDEFLSSENSYVYYTSDSTWHLTDTKFYFYDTKHRLIKMNDFDETTEYFYNDKNQLLEELNYDDTTFESSYTGYKIIYNYDEHGNNTYYEKGILNWGYYQVNTKSYYYYAPYRQPIAGTPGGTIYINVYPSPSAGQFDIFISTETINGVITTEISDITGRTMYYEKDAPVHNLTKTIDCRNYAAGIYIVSANDGKNTSWQKVVIR